MLFFFYYRWLFFFEFFCFRKGSLMMKIISVLFFLLIYSCNFLVLLGSTDKISLDAVTYREEQKEKDVSCSCRVPCKSNLEIRLQNFFTGLGESKSFLWFFFANFCDVYLQALVIRSCHFQFVLSTRGQYYFWVCFSSPAQQSVLRKSIWRLILWSCGHPMAVDVERNVSTSTSILVHFIESNKLLSLLKI